MDLTDTDGSEALQPTVTIDGVPSAYYALNHDMHYAGITYNRMMSTILHGMGVDPTEWQVAGRPGFGRRVGEHQGAGRL